MSSPAPAMLFAVAAFVFGSLFVLLTPPFQSPDEPNHFLRAYQVSEGGFFPERTAGPRLGAILPASLQVVADSFAYLKNDYSARLSPGLLHRVAGIPLAPERRGFLDFANTAIYAPVGYAPQAAAIALLRPFGAGPLLLLYAARFANLCVWILLVWAAIRLLPALHRPVAGLALLPASLAVAASANADVPVNGLCFWLFAAFCQPAMRHRSGQLLVLMGVCAAKLVTLPLGLLYGLWAKNRLFFALMLALGVVTVLIWGRFAQHRFIPYDAYDPAYRATQTLNEGVQPAAQLNFVAAHPGYFLRVVTGSYFRALPSTLAHFAGKFGWEKNYLPTAWIAAVWLALLGLLGSETFSWTIRQRGLAVLVAALFVALFSITMYALWCPVGAPVLTNLQGRYFIPLGPVVALAVSNGRLFRLRHWVVPLAFGLLMLANAAMVGAMLCRWW